jgi:hypothetical protein
MTVSPRLHPRWRREAFGYLALITPCLLLGLGLQFVYAPGLAAIEKLRAEEAQLSANVYEAAWLDSTEMRLGEQVEAAAQRLSRATARLLPTRPFQQTLDTLREAASLAGVEVLETQVATQRQDSLRTMGLRVHARGTYAGFWRWFQTLEREHAWWSVHEVVMKPAGEGAAQLDVMVHLQATGKLEALP